MPATLTSIRLDKKLADEMKKPLGVKTRTEAVHIALEEMARLQEFKDVMRKHEGKLKFSNFDR